ncbi:hypothetical protein F0562_031660 [Nyssa sinensis]|uniref:Uncharacterized protein n=1 Tax=Nyssa sinensis TaxID=561372 RepID=A0A5J5AXF9_9ASTE|nr:hypothetical protein F0562_031660 [Nyssa sinensis]
MCCGSFIFQQAVWNGLEFEVGIFGLIGRVEFGVNDSDAKASFGVKDVFKLKHGVNIALQGHWEEHQSAPMAMATALCLLHWGLAGAAQKIGYGYYGAPYTMKVQV